MVFLVFEFDPAKSAANKAKHGIGFGDAQSLWDDTRLLVVPAKTTDEMRWAAIGLLAGKHWAAFFTWRGEIIRLISVRRARTEEIAIYEGSNP